MTYFDFSRLIQKYTVSFTLVTAGEGRYNDLGDWVTDQPRKEALQGAIIGVSEAKIYRSGGVLTQRDKHLYTQRPLGEIEKAKVIYRGDVYSVEQEPGQGNAQFTGVFTYLLKWVSAFEGGDGID